MKNKKFNSGLIFLIIILAITAFIVISAILHPDSFSITSKKRKGVETSKTINKGKSKKYIAMLDIEGTIEKANSSYNQSWIMNKIENLTYDDNNVGLILFLDTPGGAVYEADEVYLSLLKYKESGKKIYSYMGATAASGGYYIACASDKIYANRNTITGSIGVISFQLNDFTGLYDKLGIKTVTIHSGRNKTMGSTNEKITEEQCQILQSVTDECYDQFVSIVSSQRKIDYKKTCKLADGRIYSAKQALELGLIDKICSWEDFITDVQNEMYDEEVTIYEYEYEKKLTFFESLIQGVSKIENSKTAANLGIPQAAFDELTQFNSYPAYIMK